MIPEKLTTLDEFLAEQMQNPEFRKEYEALEPKYEMIGRLIERRNQLKLSQTQLAKMVGMTQPAISRLERGDYNTTLGTLVKVIDALGLNLDISLKTKQVAKLAEKRSKYTAE